MRCCLRICKAWTYSTTRHSMWLPTKSKCCRIDSIGSQSNSLRIEIKHFEETLFAEGWIKKYDRNGRKFYRCLETGMTQEAKPESETYLIQAAMLGNICFLNLYMKARGNLAVEDKRGRRTDKFWSTRRAIDFLLFLICQITLNLIF